VTITLWLVALLLVLDLWGIGVGGLWTLMVSVATIIGVGFLATWAMVSNVTASLFLAIWRPFRLGDTVELLPENLKGRAIDRNLMFTVLREDGGSFLQIPNNVFFQRIFRVGGGDDHAKV
jgi:small-conductance mechanosensitive channel